MKFQGLFFLFALIALTSAYILEEIEDFDKETNEKLNITVGKNISFSYENHTAIIPITTWMTTALTSTTIRPVMTTTTIPTLTTPSMSTTTATTSMSTKMPTSISTILSPSKCNVLFFH